MNAINIALLEELLALRYDRIGLSTYTVTYVIVMRTIDEDDR